jgi:hypothetical protein
MIDCPYEIEKLVGPLVVDVGQLVGGDLEGEDHRREAAGSSSGVELKMEAFPVLSIVLPFV